MDFFRKRGDWGAKKANFFNACRKVAPYIYMGLIFDTSAKTLQIQPPFPTLPLAARVSNEGWSEKMAKGAYFWHAPGLLFCKHLFTHFASIFAPFSSSRGYFLTWRGLFLTRNFDSKNLVEIPLTISPYPAQFSTIKRSDICPLFPFLNYPENIPPKSRQTDPHLQGDAPVFVGWCSSIYHPSHKHLSVDAAAFVFFWYKTINISNYVSVLKRW